MSPARLTVLAAGTADEAERPIGVFDSGIGGLSVLNALRAELPCEDFVYFADTGHAPYGERGDAYVAERTCAVVQGLIESHRIKAMVVACNTATAAAIHLLRAAHLTLPLVGVEPALKPAVAASHTRRIGVLATRGTVNSRKFEALRQSLADQADFSVVACDGLAHAIEADDAEAIDMLCARYVESAGAFGTVAGCIDTLVLGCTHYPFVADRLRRHTGAAVRFIETGTPVAQQTHRLLRAARLLAGRQRRGTVRLEGSGPPHLLRAAALRWRVEDAAVAPATSAAVERHA